MKRLSCGTKAGRALAAIAIAGAMWSLGNAQTEQGTGGTNVIPLIVMDRVPLRDAIKNLAQQTGLNIIFAPEVAFSLGDSSPPAKQPEVSARWENLTADQALAKLLAERQLALVQDPETTVAAIGRTNRVRAVENRSLLATATNAVIPLLVMDEVPLGEAIAMLAGQAAIKLDLSRLQAATDTTRRDVSPMPTLSVRWTNITARQALVAVLDYYEFTIVPGGSDGAAQVLPREKPRVKPPGSARE